MKLKNILFAAISLSLMSCGADEELSTADHHGEEVELATSVGELTALTRATATSSVGRSAFVSGDKLVLTMMKRTAHPITNYTYSEANYPNGLPFNNDQGRWERADKNPEHLFWSDNASTHTFIGYSLPQAFQADLDNKWKGEMYESILNHFYGHINHATENSKEIVDFTTPESLTDEDVLLLYNDTLKPNGPIANLRFHHGLAQVKIVVTISGFAATNDAMDVQTKVSDMRLLDQNVDYRWLQNNAGLIASEKTQTQADIKLCPIAPTANETTGVKKKFTFKGMTVPGDQATTKMRFKVEYPDAMNPSATLTKYYEAPINDITFKAGYCTTITINLNHKGEKITVGASFTDWENQETPDLSELQKNSTYMNSTELSTNNITVHGDAGATQYDATWLYEAADGTIKDIYGHKGDTEADAYQISTANQLLSFAYEVNNKGLNFEGKYVKLDADIYMQKDVKGLNNNSLISWIMIGNGTTRFNGTFLGGGRYIRMLYGHPLFNTLGDKAIVEDLHVEGISEFTNLNTKDSQGNDQFVVSGYGVEGGMVASVNNGIICNCRTKGYVSGASSAGGIVGTNNGSLLASYHNGYIATVTYPCGGTIVACYHADPAKGGLISNDEAQQFTIDATSIKKETFVNSLNAAITGWNATASHHQIAQQYNYIVGSFPDLP